MIVASTLFLLVGIVTFIIGVFTESGLSMIVVSIGSSALAALTLLVGVLRDRKRVVTLPAGGDAAVYTGAALRESVPVPEPWGTESEEAPLLAGIPPLEEAAVDEPLIAEPATGSAFDEAGTDVIEAAPVSPSVRAARAASRSTTARKPVAVKKPAAKKPAAAKSTTAKKPAAKKPAAAKSTTARKPVARKPAAKKPAAAKSTTAKKPAAKSTTAKKPAARKPAAKKPAPPA